MSKKPVVFNVTFNYADKLTNVVTEDEKNYYFNTSDNADFVNYIVCMTDEQYGGTEYHIYRKMLEPMEQNKLTLKDCLMYLCKKMSKIDKKHIYDPEWVFQCKELNEKYTWKFIVDEEIKEIKAFAEYLSKI